MPWSKRILLALVLAGLPALFGAPGIPISPRADLGPAREELTKLLAENEELKARVTSLAAEVRALSSDEKEIERVARESLHLVRPDEVVFRIVAEEAEE